MNHDNRPTYLGVTIDWPLTYKPHIRKVAAKTRTRNNSVHILAGTAWGAGTKTLRTSALALCYSVAEYCAPVWRNSAHTYPVDVQLNNTMMAINGAVRCTMTDRLPVLSNIAPGDIRREVETFRTILRASLNSLCSPILTFTPDHDWNRDVRCDLTSLHLCIKLSH